MCVCVCVCERERGGERERGLPRVVVADNSCPSSVQCRQSSGPVHVKESGREREGGELKYCAQSYDCVVYLSPHQYR